MVRSNNDKCSEIRDGYVSFYPPTIEKTWPLERGYYFYNCEEGIVHRNSSTERHPAYRLEVDRQGEIFLVHTRSQNLSIFSENR